MDTYREYLERNYGHKMSDVEIDEALDHAEDEGAIEFYYGGEDGKEDSKR